MKKTIGIYIHIPFCNKKCAYCDFYSECGANDDDKKAYADALKKHISEYKNMLGSYEIDTVYFGGGTPSCMPKGCISSIVEHIRKCANVSKNAEITTELNPESTEASLLSELKSCGVNRLSIGVQSADDSELSMLGRLHSFEMAQNAVNLAKKYGFSNISLDMMYGLPSQTIDGALDSLDKIIALSPSHISAYALKLEQGTKMYSLLPTLPDDDAVADMYLAIVDKLEKFGYKQYEISNFARDGMHSRHNSRYWDLSEYLGIGAGAHSFVGERRFANISDYKRYTLALSAGGEVIEENEEQTSIEDRFGEHIMLALRTSEGIDEDKLYRIFHRDFVGAEKTLKKYADLGYAKYGAGKFSLTPKGFFISNTIINDVISNMC